VSKYSQRERQGVLGPEPYPPSQPLSLLAHAAGGGSWQGDLAPEAAMDSGAEPPWETILAQQ